MDAPLTLRHPRDLLAWHGASAACMVAMVAVALPGWLSAAALVLFAAGLAWCVVQAVRLPARAAYLRLGVCCVAMLVMLVPGHAVHAAHPQGMAMATGSSMTGAAETAALPGLLVTVLVAALVAVAAVGVVGLARSPRSRASRLAVGCESLLAAAMAAMLVGAL
jgi:uncharacterized protein DUF5134